MELALPFIALGGLYVISNQQKKQPIGQTNEGFRNNLPNTNIPPQNYPVTDNKQLVDTVQQYPNPNTATDKYFNQNVFELKDRAGVKTGSEIQQIYSLTGNYMDSKEFTHNNMVPFNGKKPRGQVYNVDTSETILDNYVGSGSQTIKKIEQAPLFKPQENVQWTYGAPNMSDFYQSRVNPVNRNNMVKPFESVMVGPGLDQGYTNKGSDGFNAGMEARDKWLPKTVDELRVATNPKESYSLEGLQGPAQSGIKNVGIYGKMEKNRPDTFFVNSQDRWLTTTGAEKGNRYVSEEVLKDSNRNDTTTYLHGSASSALKTASYVPQQYSDVKKIQLEGFDVGHSTATRTAPHCTDKDNCLASHTNYVNNRSNNLQPETFGSGFSKALGAVIAPVMDILRPSRKEEYSDNIRIYGNGAGEVPGNYVLTQGDVPNTTIKETTLYEPRSYVGNQKDNAGYLVSRQQPIQNQRDTTTDYMSLGPMGSKYGNMQYDHAYRATTNTVKEGVVSSTGRINQGNASHFNPTINVSTSRYDTDRDNNRMWVPSATVHSGPSVATMGFTNAPQYLPQENNDRLNPDLLNAFKENPYTQSLYSVA